MATVERSFRRNSSSRGHFAIGCATVKFRPREGGGWLRSGFRDWKERGGVNALGRRKEGRRESWKKELSGIVDDREDEGGGRSPPRRF